MIRAMVGSSSPLPSLRNRSPAPPSLPTSPWNSPRASSCVGFSGLSGGATTELLTQPESIRPQRAELGFGGFLGTRHVPYHR